MSLVLVAGDGGEILESVLLNGVSNENTSRAYRRALQKFIAWHNSNARGELSLAMMQAYRAWLEACGAAVSSVNQELSALRKMFCNPKR